MVVQLQIENLQIKGFRNIERLEIEPSPRFNVLVGDNGQGKTSVLEAIYVLATTKSFRTENLLREALRKGDPLATIAARINEDGAVKEQRVSFDRERRVVLRDGRKPERLVDYARSLPVVVFHPEDLALVSGSSGLRRVLLDRVALFDDPVSAVARSAYQRAARGRKLALERPGAAHKASSELDAYEQLMARHGARWAVARERAFGLLREALLPAFAEIGGQDTLLEVVYHPGGSVSEQECLEQLGQRRSVDRERRTVTFGPGRDDVSFAWDSRPLRRQGSQGQKRLLALALKLAERDCVRRARGAEPILLLDDIASELDPTRTSAVYDFLDRSLGQIFVTTTRPEFFRGLTKLETDRKDHRLVRGSLVPTPSWS